MKIFIVGILTLLFLGNCSSKRIEDTATTETGIRDSIKKVGNDTDTTIYTYVEQMPSFPGGESEMHRFVSSNLKYPIIPEEQIMDNLKTIIRFTVTKTGEIINIEPAKPQYKNTILTDSLTAVIKRMPRWIPGKQNGREVNVYYTIPLHVSPSRR